MVRIVSLISSSTEIVYALGHQDWLVGRSHECDYPPGIRKLPQCTSTKFDPDGTSYQIDQRVKAILQEGLSVYRVDGDLLRLLKPDVILTQTQCEVCAVSERDVLEATADWFRADERSAPKVVSLHPNALEDLWADIRKVAEALGSAHRAEGLIAKLKGRISAVQRMAARAKSRPTVACIEWVDPLMAAGNWVPEMVELAGGTNLFGVAGKHSPYMTWDEILARDPERILILPCGFDLKRTFEEVPLLRAKPGWADLRAVREGQVFVADGNQYFNRPGPRLVDSLEILAEILHPELFDFGFEGLGWRRI
jgi:iron complex transport system substrate-binding protein